MRRSALMASVWVVVFCSVAAAQIGTSTLVGQVSDSSGAVLPGVSVTAVQPDTGFRFDAVTNEAGLFRIQGLQPGEYRVTFDLTGFGRLVRESIQLSAGDTVRVNGALEVGQVTDDIEVVGKPPLLATETSDTGTVMEGEMLYELPLYQRFANSALTLVPGTSSQGYAYAGSLGNFHVAGQRNTAIASVIDGMIANNPVGGTTTVRATQNSVAETKIYTGTLPAEFGHTAGGVVSVTKKTGTNDLHGMASVLWRSGHMQHRNFFDRERTANIRFMQPDAYLGGPVVLPGVYDGHGKTFFFVSFERLLDKQVVQLPGEVPSPAMKQGDFSLGGIGNPIFDPATTRQLPDGTWTRDPFPGNVIPQERIDAVARRILDADPWLPPNQPGSLSPEGPVSNLLYDRRGRVDWNDFSARLDHQFRPAFTVYGSYQLNESRGNPGRPTNMKVEDDLQDFAGGSGRQTDTLVHIFSGGNTWVLSPTLVSSTRVGYQRRFEEQFAFSWGKSYGEILGIPNISGEMLPSFGTGNEFSPSSLYGITPTGPSRDVSETYSFQTDLTQVKGSHTLKMGYQFLRLSVDSTNTNIPSGRFSFGEMTAGLQPDGNPMPNTGNTFAGFLLGYVRQAEFDRELTSWRPRSNIHGLFIQDDWNLTSSLTLNLGLRYTNESPYNASQLSNFDPTAIDEVTGQRGAIVHPDTPLHARDNNNFQPRVGLAWHPLERWAFRAGFGVNTVDVKFPLSRGNFDEFVAVDNQQRAPGDPRPLFRISEGPQPVDFDVRPNGTAPFVGENFGAREVRWWDPELRNPYVMNWNLSVQFQAADNYLIEAMYQGSAGVGLVEQWEVNTFPVDFGADDPDLRAAAFRAPQDFRPYPHFGSIQMRSNFGHSTYHGGTLKVQKRYSHGLTFLSHYTFSKAINTQDGDNDGNGVAPIQNRSLEKARASYDRTHVFTSSILYELPIGQGRAFLNRGGPVNAILGGWDISWIQTFQSGNPLTFAFAGSPNNYYPEWVGARRPDLVSRPELVDNWREFGDDRFNTANINPIIDINHFAYPDAFTPGNTGRNILTGTPLIWSAASVQKNLTLSGQTRLQVRLDFNNPLKTWNFNPPNTTVNLQTPETFGKVTGNPVTANFGGLPLMNLSVRVIF
ncbi:MAG: hypothetical protein GEV06_07275 [Luteitalea sp.]|nr:hypothetical protein [Luteitalea sp.]